MEFATSTLNIRSVYVISVVVSRNWVYITGAIREKGVGSPFVSYTLAFLGMNSKLSENTFNIAPFRGFGSLAHHANA